MTKHEQDIIVYANKVFAFLMPRNTSWNNRDLAQRIKDVYDVSTPRIQVIINVLEAHR